jgi:hypothetical protein
MPNKRYKPEQVVTLLRQIEVELANGKSTPQACKEAEITVQTYYRWRKEFGGLKLDQAKRLKELESGWSLEGAPSIEPKHLSEAIQHRTLDRTYGLTSLASSSTCSS